MVIKEKALQLFRVPSFIEIGSTLSPILPYLNYITVAVVGNGNSSIAGFVVVAIVVNA